MLMICEEADLGAVTAEHFYRGAPPCRGCRDDTAVEGPGVSRESNILGVVVEPGGVGVDVQVPRRTHVARKR